MTNNQYQPEEKTKMHKGLFWLLLGLLLAAVVALMFWFVSKSSSVVRKPVPEVVQLQIIQPPPPPPPPPPQPEDQPPPEPEPKPEVEPMESPKEEPPPDQPESKPEPAADNQAEAGPVGLDAQGQGPADGFGLAGNPGGQSSLGGGNGSGGGIGGSGPRAHGRYAALLQSRIRNMLQKERELKRNPYEVKVQLWLSSSGQPEKVMLVGTTGDTKVDQIIESTIMKMSALSEPIPEGLPKPIVLQVRSS
jgi:hypothetical protein